MTIANNPFEVMGLERLVEPGPILLGHAEQLAKIRQAAVLTQPSLRPVINASGVIIHTNLGRAPLADVAIKRVGEVAAGYSTLEYDLVAGGRGSRHDHLSDLLSSLTGAEAGLAVNNCSAREMMQAAKKRPRTVMRFIVEFMILFIVLLSFLKVFLSVGCHIRLDAAGYHFRLSFSDALAQDAVGRVERVAARGPRHRAVVDQRELLAAATLDVDVEGIEAGVALRADKPASGDAHLRVEDGGRRLRGIAGQVEHDKARHV